jgi:IS4 transposase
MKYRVVKRLGVDRTAGVTRDRVIRLTGSSSKKLGKWPMRLVSYIDPQSGKRLTFLTNHLVLAAAHVALLYRKRWKIELLFKWMKQHLHIESFFGTTPNAVKTQIWIAILTLVLVHRLKHQLCLRQTPNEITQILSVTLCEKTPINQAFFDNPPHSVQDRNHNQLQLFEL